MGRFGRIRVFKLSPCGLLSHGLVRFRVLFSVTAWCFRVLDSSCHNLVTFRLFCPSRSGSCTGVFYLSRSGRARVCCLSRSGLLWAVFSCKGLVPLSAVLAVTIWSALGRLVGLLSGGLTVTVWSAIGFCFGCHGLAAFRCFSS